jgi:hypothetical protein
VSFRPVATKKNTNANSNNNVNNNNNNVNNNANKNEQISKKFIINDDINLTTSH